MMRKECPVAQEGQCPMLKEVNVEKKEQRIRTAIPSDKYIKVGRTFVPYLTVFSGG